MLKEFKEFAMRGNVVDMAVGIVLGAAFGKIVSSFVKDVLMPPIGLLLGDMNFSDLFVTLKGETFATLAEAKEAGAVTINYAEGPPSGPPLVFLHGGGARWRAYEDVLLELARSVHLFAPDLRGHGHSGRAPGR